MTFHELRHSFASLWIKQFPGKSYELRLILGHQAMSTTERYVHMDQEHLRRLGCLDLYDRAARTPLLQRFYRNIPLSPDGKLVVRCPVDYRKIYSRVSDNYFGNAVIDAITCFDPNTFPDLSLSEVASEIRSAIASIDEASIYESLACLNDLRLEKGIDIFENVGCPGLLVSNLSKLPFDAMDFGIGKPTEIFHASLNPRLAVILPDGEGIKIKFNVPTATVDESHVPSLEEFLEEWKQRVYEENPDMTDIQKMAVEFNFAMREHQAKNPKYFENLRKFLDKMKAKYPQAFKK